MEIHQIHVPVTTNQMCFSGITNLMGGPRFKKPVWLIHADLTFTCKDFPKDVEKPL
jgi:hypothetical protein